MTATDNTTSDSVMEIEFVNHASFLLKAGGTAVLCDPWLFGSAFLDGWDLLCRSDFPLERFREVPYIWFSHEHPDHFSPAVLKSVPEALRPNITVLYQATKDKKVVGFCEKLGFRTRELADHKITELTPGLQVQCGAVLPFDSWICFRSGGRTVLNVNDCVVDGAAKASAIAKIIGPVDVLFTQFSYAAWKGNEADDRLRAESAASKLRIVAEQVKAIRPKYVVPFASFMYFSHVENKYMNRGVNEPPAVCAAVQTAGAEPVLLYPGDRWTVGTSHDNTSALSRYRDDYAGLPDRAYRSPTKSLSEAELQASCKAYLTRLRSKNNFTLIRLARLLPLVRAFQPFAIRVTDLGAVFRFDMLKGLEKLPDGSPWDVSMHSECLDYVFRFDWGYDTLTVNGRFRADMDGFVRMTKNFAIGPLNNIGRRISFGLLFDFGLLGGFLKSLARFAKRSRAVTPAGRS
jgi:L-ascorbate metabolism protein UlaG (beta-lactamase superfamily)